MKWKVSVLVLAAMVFLAALVAVAGKVLFEDRFTTLDPAWGVEASDMVNVKDGKLVITPKKDTAQTILNQANLLPNDMEASYTMGFVKAGDPNYGGGFVFWAKDTGDFYSLPISPEGQFAVSHLTAGRWLHPVPWRASDALKKGAGAVNQVKLVTKGNRGTVFFNGKEVISFSGQPPQGGGLIGLHVDSGPAGENSTAFSDFKIMEP